MNELKIHDFKSSQGVKLGEINIPMMHGTGGRSMFSESFAIPPINHSIVADFVKAKSNESDR